MTTSIDDPTTAALHRRRSALHEAANEAARIVRAGRGPAVVTRLFGEGCVAFALGGTFDAADIARLRSTAAELEHAGHRELAVDLGELRRSSTPLARALGRIRIRFLLVGARVEWHRAPAELRDALRGPTQAYSEFGAAFDGKDDRA